MAKERKQNEESRDGIFLNYRREDTDFPAQMNSSFGKLERQMQVESAAIQNQGYRRVEGLQRWM